MAHLIDMSNGKENLAFVGDRQEIWHGLGQQITANMTPDEQRIAAGLNWGVEKREVFYNVESSPGETLPQLIDDRFALVRSDTQESLYIASGQYKIVQPKQVVEFFSDMISDMGFQMSSLGSLKDGKVVFANASTNKAIRLKGTDELKGYCLLTTSFDGSLATMAKHTSIRTVCMNTLAMATRGQGKAARVSHRSIFDADKIKREMGIYAETFEQFEHDVFQLSETKITSSSVEHFFKELFAEKAVTIDKKSLSIIPSSTVKKIVSLAANGKGQNMTSAKGTLWGLVNGVTEYYDHNAKARSDDHRAFSSQFGQGDTIKNKAFRIALEMAA
ncbi:MAG: DUF932 domain-containing protein [Pseudomonadales bacterium]|nr:DUF932 domain-containing protein [Pseudomonadales bacterium]